MPTPPTTTAELFGLIRKSGIMPSAKIAALEADEALANEAPKAAGALVKRGVLTRFQVQQLLAGRHKGFRIGGHVILDLLGKGGMGAVYLAEHIELHRKVAIKVLVPGREEDAKLARDRFLREARAAAALDHPNIVRIFDVSRHNDTPYLVMEYVEGNTLQQLLDRDGPIPYGTATEYIAQAAAGLQHAFEKGFIHRDIKPGNLILDKSGTIKILDMGLARTSKPADKLTEVLDKGAVVGTADFIAPEQALNNPNIDVRADIYSLGATFYALIAGKPPFEGNTTQKLIQHQLKDAPDLASLEATVPAGLSDVVATMLAKKPQHRYQTPGEVIGALTLWMGNSARILIGLSRTNLAVSGDVHETLATLSRAGSSRRLRSEPTGSEIGLDSSDVNPSTADQETGAVAAAPTIRESRLRKPVTNSSRNRILIYIAAGLAILVAGALFGWLAFGK